LTQINVSFTNVNGSLAESSARAALFCRPSGGTNGAFE
jgi:hypothetical protein